MEAQLAHNKEDNRSVLLGPTLKYNYGNRQEGLRQDLFCCSSNVEPSAFNR